jgi:hypothetical protein
MIYDENENVNTFRDKIDLLKHLKAIARASEIGEGVLTTIGRQILRARRPLTLRVDDLDGNFLFAVLESNQDNSHSPFRYRNHFMYSVAVFLSMM